MVRGLTNSRGYRGARGISNAMYFPGGRPRAAASAGALYGYGPQLIYGGRGSMFPPVYQNPYMYKGNGPRFGLMRGQGYFMYHTAFPGKLRRRQSVAIDRRRRRQQNFNPAPVIYRRQRRGRGRRRGGRPVSRSELDAQLDAYMGDDVTKTRLDSQLDAYFGRIEGHTGSAAVTSVHEQNNANHEKQPFSDSSDVPMGGGSTAKAGERSKMVAM